MALINTNLLNWQNILFIALVAVVAHHFGKNWMKPTGDVPVA